MASASFELKRHPAFSSPPSKPLCLIIFDGLGVGSGDEYDAVTVANTPHLDALYKLPLYRTVKAHGTAVGLPSDGDMGNSEVGHNALGCGRIVRQGAALVDDNLASGEIFNGAGWKYLEEAYKKDGSTLHLIGLLSDGGVHSRFDQLEGLIRGAKSRGAKRIRLHVLADGRDVEDHTAHKYVKQLEDLLTEIRGDGTCDAKIASGGGRMVTTMDRYESDWSIVERGWRAHVLGDARTFPSAEEAIQTLRSEKEGVSDQFLPAWVVAGSDGKAVGAINDGDAVLTFNFRGDRMVEIAQAFDREDFSAFDRERVPAIHYCGMIVYDNETNLPRHTLVDPPKISRTSGEYLVHNGTRTLATTETQKFGHVTYFWNGNRTGYFDDKLEEYHEIPSDQGIPFDEKPAMKCHEIADDAIAGLKSGKFDCVRLNFPNPDMVGHTGNFKATVVAMEEVDKALGKVLAAVEEIGGTFLVTADHGNAEDMVQRSKAGAPVTDKKTGKAVALTSHTLNPVPLVIGGPGLPANVRMRSDLPNAGLTNVTATFINLLGFEAPEDYEASCIEFV